ncbi:MAG: hypothetical protein JSW67_03285 [Candidatus Latescibacterota bacterium]|nr:MAG: hypothetical protein JSW67_03285 [Candidatus Latescibacterota bacterium]
MRIQRPHPDVMELTPASRKVAALVLAFFAVSEAFWCSIVSFDIVSINLPIPTNEQVNKLIVCLLPIVISVLPMVSLLKHVLTGGETFTLNRESSLIARNGERLAHFSDVDKVQIRTIEDSSYRMSVVLKNGHQIPIVVSADEFQIWLDAEDIAGFIGVKVWHEDGGRGRG